jgi:hypothetical protein
MLSANGQVSAGSKQMSTENRSGASRSLSKKILAKAMHPAGYAPF